MGGLVLVWLSRRLFEWFEGCVEGMLRGRGVFWVFGVAGM